MNTFPGWRSVGRAMRLARRQDGVTVSREDNGTWITHTWRYGDRADHVELGGAGTLAYSLTVDLADGRYLEASRLPAAEILRVLAALGLLPREIAEMRDERYGRCEKCGERCVWVPAAEPFEPRWVHADRIRVWAEHGAHLAEVAA